MPVKNLKLRLNNFFNSSIIHFLPAGVFFLFSNYLIIVYLYLSSGHLLFEIFKWLQFLALIILLFYFRQFIGKYAILLAVFLLYFFYFILASYSFLTASRLDFSFLRRNAVNIGSILPEFYIYLLVLACFAFANWLFIDKLKFIYQNKFKKIILFVLIIITLSSFFIKTEYSNDLIVFAKSMFEKDEIINYYELFYQSYLSKTNKTNRDLVDYFDKLKKEKENQPAFLDNIIILHLESLNGFLVSPEITPNFLKIAQEGVLFPKFYANGVQTILGYENILCGLPGSFKLNLIDSHFIDQAFCLPAYFKKFGYKNYFFKGGTSLQSSRTDDFMKTIGFDELHNNDIMQDGDIRYPWGYREDIFYERVFEYLKPSLKQKNFIYIDVGSTNHWPFNTPPEQKESALFLNPKNHRERIINTTYLQDRHLETAWRKINELFPQKNYTLLVLGDHAWPIEQHAGNTFNEKNAYEENFTTALALVIGNEFKGRVITEAYSQMDILPSIVELFGAVCPADSWRRSFIPELKSQPVLSANILQIQPYSGKYINIIIEGGRVKYQYNFKEKKFLACDLAKDPLEKKCLKIGGQKRKNLEIIKELLPLEANN